MSGIFWLASYPKSGNTWLRLLLANLLRGNSGPAALNGEDLARQRSNNVSTFDDAAGVEASDLTDDEIERIRPLVYRHLAAQSKENLFLKTHDTFDFLPGGAPRIPPDVTMGAVYILRNPLDVAISFAHYSMLSIDRIIDSMASGYTVASNPSSGVLRQQLPPWSEHVQDWIDRPPFPVHPIRYEDLHEHPLETFAAAARFCGLPYDAGSVERAVNASSFDRLQAEEGASGFSEKPEITRAFFRQGKANAWRDVLSGSQIARIVDHHAAVMRRFGYLPL